MSKKKWLLAIVVLFILGYLIISKVFPTWGAGIDNLLGPAVAGLAAGIYSAVNNSPIWQAWDIWISGAFFAIITALLMWQGHNAYNKIRGAAVVSAAKEAGYQVAPVATPAVIPSTPAATPTPQIVVPEPEPAPTPEAKE